MLGWGLRGAYDGCGLGTAAVVLRGCRRRGVWCVWKRNGRGAVSAKGLSGTSLSVTESAPSRMSDFASTDFQLPI
jgi:hypothetical protein